MTHGTCGEMPTTIVPRLRTASSILPVATGFCATAALFFAGATDFVGVFAFAGAAASTDGEGITDRTSNAIMIEQMRFILFLYRAKYMPLTRMPLPAGLMPTAPLGRFAISPL